MSPSNALFIMNRRGFRTHSSAQTREGWLAWLGKKKKIIALVFICMLSLHFFRSRKSDLPPVVLAGAPVLHQPAREVYPGELRSDCVQKVIDDMEKVMRKQHIFSLSAPQIGVPLRDHLKLYILKGAKSYIADLPDVVSEERDRHPFDLMVIVNPQPKVQSNKTALFFESCVSVDGYSAMVERFLEVEVTGLDRHGQPITVDASGWKARMLQHECDHLEGTLYVDKMIKGTSGL